MRSELAFSIVLTLACTTYFLAAFVLAAMIMNGDFDDTDALVRGVIIGVVCIEFAVSGLVAVALARRFLRGSYSIAWTDTAVIALTLVFPPALAILLWWFLGIRKSVVAETAPINGTELNDVFG